MIYQLVYWSKSAYPFSEKELDDLLVKARIYNNSVEITGFLLFGENTFFQVLEGDEQAVKSLYYDKIAKDDRHQETHVVGEWLTDKRQFGDWSMGYQKLGDPSEIEGFRDVSSWRSFEFLENFDLVRKLMLSFACSHSIHQDSVMRSAS